MSYYLKYRPQKVADLDMAVAREAFAAVLASGQFAQAYLLSGPKGTGKTSSARILAKVLNCAANAVQLRGEGRGERGELNEPCGECESCVTIARGSSMAVVEMDAASNRGIDDIRQLKERVGLAPAQGLFTVYVIDEVHMLTTEAFNALLKTLEEPPAHAVFVLCTTEAHKIPATVVSRCTKITFKKATPEEVVHSLQKAVEGEELQFEEGVLEAIAARVDGSFRDGMKILEQLAGQATKITLTMVDELTGFSSEYEVTALIEALLAKDVPTGLAYLQARDELGVDWSILSKRVVEELRGRLLAEMTNNPPSHRASEGQGKSQVTNLVGLIELFSKAVVEMKQTVVPQLPLELAVVEWGMGQETAKVAKVPEVPEVRKVSNGSEASKASKVPEASKACEVSKVSEVRKVDEVVRVSNPLRNDAGEDALLSQVKPSSQPVSDNQAEPVESANTVSLDEVQRRWNEVMQGVRPYNHSLEALLRAARPLKIENNWIILEVFYAFHKEQLEQERYLRILEKVMAGLFGDGSRLRFVLANGAVRQTESSNVTGQLQDERVAEVAEEIFG